MNKTKEIIVMKKKVKISAAEKRFSILLEKISEIDKRLRNVEKHAHRLIGFDPPVVEKYLDSIKAEVLVLHGRLQREIGKICVVTELCFVARRGDNSNQLHEIQGACIWAFEQDDKFWKDMADKPINEVRTIILKAYRIRISQ